MLRKSRNCVKIINTNIYGHFVISVKKNSYKHMMNDIQVSCLRSNIEVKCKLTGYLIK